MQAHFSSRMAVAVALALSSTAAAQVGSSYFFGQSVGVYSPITGGTLLATATPSSSLDDVTFGVTLPFLFRYDNLLHTQVWINSNGWLGFGATSPGTTNYAPLQSSTVTPGFVAAFGRDLHGGFAFAGSRIQGSNLLTSVSSLGPIQIGDAVVGSGIPAGTTITAIAGNTLTMSANATATSAATAVTAYGPWSEMRWQVQGVSPNRVFVAQWSYCRRYGTTLATTQDMFLNFQIRLQEDGKIEAVYGNCSPGATTYAVSLHQVGLRGPTNAFPADVNCRLNAKGASDWATSTPGTANSSGQLFNNVAPANVIPSGLTYTWTPLGSCNGTPAPGNTIGPAGGACPGATFTLSLQTPPNTGLTYQWFYGPSSTGPWLPLGTAATQVASQTTDTWYYCAVTCGSAVGSSTPVRVAMAGPASFPQDFSTGAIDPNCWSVTSVVGNFLPTYSSSSAFASGFGSARFGFFGYFDPLAQMALTSPQFAPTVAGDQIFFDVAGATSNVGEVDEVRLQGSNDGGVTWATLVTMTNNAAGGVLNTAGVSISAFVPTAGQWASLAYAATPGTNRIRLLGDSDWGNHVYFDNISVGVSPSARHTVYGLGCGTAPVMSLNASPAPVSTGASGTTVVYAIGSIPLACPAPAPLLRYGVVMLSLGQDFAGAPLGTLAGALDCNLHITSLDVTLGFVGASASQTVNFTVPAAIPGGFLFYAQAAALVCPAAANSFDVLLSNGVRSYINNF